MLSVDEKNEMILAMNACKPESEIPYLDIPDGQAFYQELLTAQEMGMAAFPLLEAEEDPDEDREWEHQAIHFVHMG